MSTRSEYDEELMPVLDAIDESSRLLDLSDNWDGEGSPGYSEATWRRAADFIRSTATRLWIENATCVKAPELLPGPNGAIDIEWEEDGKELVVRVPSSDAELGETVGGND